MSRSANPDVLQTIFREYVGVKPYPDYLTDFPVYIIDPNTKEFHFILGLATEGHEYMGKGTGIFNPTWNSGYFSAEKIKRMKDAYQKVKVVISIGGRGSQLAFNPAEKFKWIENATRSLKQIIQDYNDHCSCNLIDGIDIYYEIIKSSETEFATCIGKVIKSLKHEFGLINVVSIAPSALVRAHYYMLYKSCVNDINWVDYRFSDDPAVTTKFTFVAAYRQLSHDYREKLLAGFSTDPVDSGKISEEDFLEGCKDLRESKLLPGICCWNANDSAVPHPPKPPFDFEIKAQRPWVYQD